MTSDKIKLTLLLLMTAVPILLATWMFSLREGTGVSATTNKGELIVPVLDITELDLRDASGELVFRTFEEEVAGIDPGEYRPRPWLLVYLGGASCDAACEERLHFLRQLHLRLGADAARLQRWYLNTGDAPLAERTRELFAERFPGLETARGDAAVIRANLARTLSQGEDPIRDHYIYVSDPVGNVMLYFTPENSPEDILEDLEQLLDASSLG